jgi:two-component system, OmpR family, response regulator
VKVKTYLVEDNATIRENLIATLEELTEISVAGVAEGEREAIEWLTKNQTGWSLAIVDIFLKQGTGLGVLSAFKARAAGQRMVVLSNYVTADVKARCVSMGADAVFDKSNDIEALLEYCATLQ